MLTRKNLHTQQINLHNLTRPRMGVKVQMFHYEF